MSWTVMICGGTQQRRLMKGWVRHHSWEGGGAVRGRQQLSGHVDQDVYLGCLPLCQPQLWGAGRCLRHFPPHLLGPLGSRRGGRRRGRGGRRVRGGLGRQRRGDGRRVGLGRGPLGVPSVKTQHLVLSHIKILSCTATESPQRRWATRANHLQVDRICKPIWLSLFVM